MNECVTISVDKQTHCQISCHVESGSHCEWMDLPGRIGRSLSRHVPAFHQFFFLLFFACNEPSINFYQTPPFRFEVVLSGIRETWRGAEVCRQKGSGDGGRLSSRPLSFPARRLINLSGPRHRRGAQARAGAHAWDQLNSMGSFTFPFIFPNAPSTV